jgi:hypothetical protein
MHLFSNSPCFLLLCFTDITMSFARIKTFWRKKHLVLTKGQATSTRLSLKAHQLPSTIWYAEAEHYIENILRIYAGVSQLTDLRPSSITDTLFNELVGLCVTVIQRTISDLVRNIVIPQSKPNVDGNLGVARSTDLCHLAGSSTHLCSCRSGARISLGGSHLKHHNQQRW